MGDGTVLYNKKNFSHDYSSKGVYTVKQFVYNLDCVDSSTKTIVVINSTGIPDKTKNNFWIQLYPNPAAGEINFETKEVQNYHFELVNTLGKIIYRTQFNRNKLTVDIKSCPPGIYFYKFVTEQGTTQTGKIIRQQ